MTVQALRYAIELSGDSTRDFSIDFWGVFCECSKTHRPLFFERPQDTVLNDTVLNEKGACEVLGFHPRRCVLVEINDVILE